ncbi:hypothetical protein PROFUN_03201 [Planoprotostelium fungivorum]|uniref:Uncharacterized protein n=1 Tax=Planoprotostelium fungivorum TaxID=1890364 RepID=A0A2P6NWY9_9EUKA|nr:hypothetical protein PROFUN_03201 [Planoprotostelium fungivorum]
MPKKDLLSELGESRECWWWELMRSCVADCPGFNRGAVTDLGGKRRAAQKQKTTYRDLYPEDGSSSDFSGEEASSKTAKAKRKKHDSDDDVSPFKVIPKNKKRSGENKKQAITLSSDSDDFQTPVKKPKRPKNEDMEVDIMHSTPPSVKLEVKKNDPIPSVRSPSSATDNLIHKPPSRRKSIRIEDSESEKEDQPAKLNPFPAKIESPPKSENEIYDEIEDARGSDLDESSESSVYDEVNLDQSISDEEEKTESGAMMREEEEREEEKKRQQQEDKTRQQEEKKKQQEEKKRQQEEKKKQEEKRKQEEKKQEEQKRQEEKKKQEEQKRQEEKKKQEKTERVTVKSTPPSKTQTKVEEKKIVKEPPKAKTKEDEDADDEHPEENGHNNDDDETPPPEEKDTSKITSPVRRGNFVYPKQVSASPLRKGLGTFKPPAQIPTIAKQVEAERKSVTTGATAAPPVKLRMGLSRRALVNKK